MPLLDVLVRRAKAGAVEVVIVGGDIVYMEGRFLNVDRNEALTELSASLSRADTTAETERSLIARHLIEPVKRFYENWTNEK